MTTENTRGRKPAFADKFAVVDALEKIQTGEFKSRYLTLKLVELGFVKTNNVKGEGRGRPRVTFELTGKGRGRIGLAKNWKR